MVKIEDLKVGMKVKLKANLNETDAWVDYMKQDCIVTIQSIYAVVTTIGTFTLEEDNHPFRYTVDMIERIVE